MKCMTKQSLFGYSLIELLIVITMITITVTMVMHFFKNNYLKQKLKQASWTLYSDMMYAKSLANSTNTAIYLNFQTGNNWCFGLSNQNPCNCAISANCTVYGVERVLRYSNATGITLDASGFTSTNLIFETSRGLTSSGKGTFTFTGGSFSIQVRQNNINNILLCSDTVGGFPACT